MAKPKSKILWSIMAIAAAFIVAIITIPPMIKLNFIKEKIENAIVTKTGVPIKIHGDINVSLLGHATIVAHNITVPNGVISTCEFDIPFVDIFDIKNANISDKIIINNATFTIEKLVPFNINTPIVLRDSKIHFLDKEYKIISADLSKKSVHATVRTDQHKYEINSTDNNFIIKNHNNNLELIGQLYPDGTANAQINIIAQDVNKWFEFEKPRILGQFPISAEINWNGGYGINFTNISARGVSGNVYFQENGYKIIDLKSENANYDLSFFVKNPDIFQTMQLNLDLYGKLQFVDKTFQHVKINTVGNNDKIQINEIIADDLHIRGGYIDKNGAHNVNVTLPENNINTTCVFNGTSTQWNCEHFSYGDIFFGKLNVNTNQFYADIKSTKNIPNIKSVIKSAKMLGDRGTIVFDFPNMSGKITINKNEYDIKYEHLDNKTLDETDTDLAFLPQSMRQEVGNFIWDKQTMMFIPISKTWHLSMTGDAFILHGDNFKKWFPDLDLRFINDFDYTISGNYKNDTISNLKIEIAGHVFNGTMTKKSITLHTDLLNVDYFITQQFKENFDELSFFVQSPILIPFDIGTNIALSAQSMIYNNERYNNFVYSLHKNTQTFSISDSDLGNMLTTITRDKIKYDINIQLNNFVFNKKLLPDYMPLNISDTKITAEIKLKTYGKIAHDIIDNMAGTFDISLKGGKIYGLGIDAFYSFAPNITTMNAEEILSIAMTSGTSEIKNMRIIGTYEKGDIKTTRPLILSMKHVDIIGETEIINNKMSTRLKLVLRGTSPSPEAIDLTIYPNNHRDFSLSEIMMNFDPEYMRTFTQSHIRF